MAKTLVVKTTVMIDTVFALVALLVMFVVVRVLLGLLVKWLARDSETGQFVQVVADTKSNTHRARTKESVGLL